MLRRLVHDWDVLRQVISIFGSGPPAINSEYKIFDGACPFNQNILLPCRLLQGQTERYAGRVHPDWYADYRIAY